jgi:hypothetical protein
MSPISLVCALSSFTFVVESMLQKKLVKLLLLLQYDIELGI